MCPRRALASSPVPVAEPDPAPRTPNPVAFVEAVHAYLAHARDQFNYDALVHTFLDDERFRRWAAVVERYRTVRDARVLSSGCGLGGSLVAWHDAGARVAVGLEVDDDYVRMANVRVASLGEVAVLPYDGRRVPVRDGAFDVVESLDVIEHTPDPRAYLAELRRVLAPGGLVLLVTPNRLWPVEQHLGIVGPPWLPVGAADAVWSALSRLPRVDEDHRFRWTKLRGMRTQNLSLRALRALAISVGLRLRLLRERDAGPTWPLPPNPPRVERMLDSRLLRFAAPVKTLAVVLDRPGDGGA